MESRRIVIASNRGPISFKRDERGEVVAKRGAGGLVTAVGGALQNWGGVWIASAMSDEDREQAAKGLTEVAAEDTKYSLRYLAFDPETYDGYYNGISNRVLWFLHHYLWDTARFPRFGDELHEWWAAYRRVNEAFATALHEEGQAFPEPPAYLVQDYHLLLVPALLREREPEAAISLFAHVPWAGPTYLRLLPTAMREELLGGILGADVVGFHTSRWAENFLLGCRDLPGAEVDLDRKVIRWSGREVQVNAYPMSVDPEAVGGPDTDIARGRERIAEWVGERTLILRVDRADLSKNILRGFLAYRSYLSANPDQRRRVVFLALLTPSREEVQEYREYLEECLRLADRINEELGEPDWQPIRVSVEDDISLTLAAYERYDVLVVNPIFDGMNLVAKEGAALNRHSGVLILSENAGAFAELAADAIAINPFDVSATRDALAAALTMPESERGRRAERLRDAVTSNPPDRWVRAQLEDLEHAKPGPAEAR